MTREDDLACPLVVALQKNADLQAERHKDLCALEQMSLAAAQVAKKAEHYEMRYNAATGVARYGKIRIAELEREVTELRDQVTTLGHGNRGNTMIGEVTGVCRNCEERPATAWWTDEMSAMDVARNSSLAQPWCDRCMVMAQLNYARAQAARIPALELRLRDIDSGDMAQWQLLTDDQTIQAGDECQWPGDASWWPVQHTNVGLAYGFARCGGSWRVRRKREL